MDTLKRYRKRKFFECSRNNIPLCFILLGALEIAFSFSLKEFSYRIAFFNAGSHICRIGSILGLIFNIILPTPLIEINTN